MGSSDNENDDGGVGGDNDDDNDTDNNDRKGYVKLILPQLLLSSHTDRILKHQDCLLVELLELPSFCRTLKKHRDEQHFHSPNNKLLLC